MAIYFMWSRWEVKRLTLNKARARGSAVGNKSKKKGPSSGETPPNCYSKSQMTSIEHVTMVCFPFLFLTTLSSPKPVSWLLEGGNPIF